MNPVASESHAHGRSAFFDPGVIWALGVQTFRRCIRRKVLLVLALYLGVLVVGAGIVPSFNPIERLRLLVALCMSATTFFAIIIAVFLAATAIPEDRDELTIVTVLTKPVGRFNYLLGRIFGFALTLGLILLTMGAMSWGFLRISSAATAGIVLTGKRGIDPADVHMRLGDKEIPVVRSESEPDKFLLRRFGDENETLVFNFRPDLSRLPGDNLTLEVTPFIGAGIKSPVAETFIVISRRGKDVSARPVTFRRMLNSGFTSSVSFSRDLVDAVEGVEVTLRRSDADAFLRVGLGDVQIMAPPAPFEYALFKSLAVVFCGLMLVIVISVASSTFLSGWVAALATFTLCFFAFAHGDLQDYMRSLNEKSGFLGMNISSPHAHAHGGGREEEEPDSVFVRGVNHVFKGVLWLITHIVPDYAEFSTSSYLSASRDIPAMTVLRAALIAGAYALCYLLFGHLVFWKRELLA